MASSWFTGRDRFDLSGCGSGRCILLLATVGVLAGPVCGAPKDASPSEAEHLVASAAQAQISGDAARSTDLLREAIRIEPRNELAHWLLGEVRVNRKWLSADEWQRRAANDKREAEYHTRAAAASTSADDQAALAKWCNKNFLYDEARYHWSNVLVDDPNRLDALRALNLRWYKGKLLTNADYYGATVGPGAKRRHEAAVQVANCRAALEGKGKLSVEEGLATIRSLRDVEAIPLVEALMDRFHAPNSHDPEDVKSSTASTDRAHHVGQAFLSALRHMEEQPATDSLVRLAVWSPYTDVRDQAISELKARPIYNYVPMLLDGLAFHKKFSYSVETLSDGTVRYVHALYRPGLTVDHEDVELIEHTPSRKPSFISTGVGRIPVPPPIIEGSMTLNAKGWMKEMEVKTENEVNASRNRLIVNVLQKTTGQNLGDDPNAWWKFWEAHNEFYMPPKQLAYNEQYEHKEGFMMSCFVKGTPVWTKTGRRPIDSLEEGDFVLSQNVETGELKFQPVIRRTVRPPSEILKLQIDGEEIGATRGHPFWVAGVGWRMTKELGDGAMLWAVGKSIPVRTITKGDSAEAYNLVVAEFNTYFVGERGVLVHDNTPRRAARTTVPGVKHNQATSVAVKK
jgi:hypothetical protein